MLTNVARFLLLIPLLTAVCPLSAAPKTDVILMKNGDRITGEIKSLLLGKLEVSTDHIDTIYIEWEHIEEIVSATTQVIGTSDGVRLSGTLEKPDSADFVRIETPDGAISVDTDEIVAMYPVEAGFWQRLDLSAALGFSWDKSSQVGKYNLGLDAKLRDQRSISRGSLSWDLTTQEGQNATKRTYTDFTHLRFLQEKRLRVLFANAETNDELGIDLRLLAGAGYGWTPVHTQRSLFGLIAGLAVNREIPSTGAAETNLEGFGGLVYDYSTYATPERQFRVDLNVLPGLTDRGRWRARMNTTFKLEIVDDFFWSLSAYGTYDNEPLVSEASSSDYGVNSSFGYKF